MESNICIICLNDVDLIEVPTSQLEYLFNKYVKYVLPEYVVPVQQRNYFICTSCRNSLIAFKKFKSICMANNRWLISYGNDDSKIKIEITEEPLNISMEKTNTEELNTLLLQIKDEPIEEKYKEAEEPAESQELETDQKEPTNFHPFDSNVLNLSGEETKSNVLKGIFKCQICFKTFNYKGNLKTHMFKHTDSREFECNICESKFKYSSSLYAHKKTHISGVNFQCTICLKTFPVKHYLLNHMRYHTAVKPYQCSFCNLKFYRTGTLRIHEKIHKGIKDHICTICGKEFRQKGNLNTHLLIHTGIKRHECSVCHRKFSDKSAFNRHVKIHIKEL